LSSCCLWHGVIQWSLERLRTRVSFWASKQGRVSAVISKSLSCSCALKAVARVEGEMRWVARWERGVVARYRGELVGVARHCFGGTTTPHLQGRV